MNLPKNGTLAWIKLLVPFFLLAISFAAWCGRLEARLTNEMELRHNTDQGIEYVRRQNVQILQEIAGVKAHLEHLKYHDCK